MKKLAVFGGTFDPIHKGHLVLCDQMSKALEVDELLLVPAGTPPHKADHAVSSQARLDMCRIAVADSGIKASISDIEIAREGKSYTYLTVMQLLERNPDCKLYLLMGADMFITLESWYRFEDLKEKVVFCAMQRDDTDTQDLEKHAEHLRSLGCECIVHRVPRIDISSTMVRERISRHEPVSDLVTEGVERYIREHRLYENEAK